MRFRSRNPLVNLRTLNGGRPPDQPRLFQQGNQPIDGGQPHREAAAGDPFMEFVNREMIAGFHDRFQHRPALPGIAQAPPAEKFPEEGVGFVVDCRFHIDNESQFPYLGAFGTPCQAIVCRRKSAGQGRRGEATIPGS